MKQTFLLLLVACFSVVALSSFSFSSNPAKVCVNSVVNNIKVGPLTGNKNLAFGVKNVLQEALQDKEFSLTKDRFEADLVLDVEIIFFDVEQTKKGVSVFHQDANEVVVRMRGTLTDAEGKTLKTITTEDRSSEISTSTLLINETGEFNSAVQRNAVKKACVSVVSKLF
jgi:uncharacterized lipoprotein YajG